jgi:hypothetical protein
VCNGTKTLGAGPIKWSIPINEGDVGGISVKDLLYITYPTSFDALKSDPLLEKSIKFN